MFDATFDAMRKAEWEQQKREIEQQKRDIAIARSQLRLQRQDYKMRARALAEEWMPIRLWKELQVAHEQELQAKDQELQPIEEELTQHEKNLTEREAALLLEHGGREELTRREKGLEKTLEGLWACKTELQGKEDVLKAWKKELIKREERLRKQEETMLKGEDEMWTEGKETTELTMGDHMDTKGQRELLCDGRGRSSVPESSGSTS